MQNEELEIKEIMFKDFPWDEMPWARIAPGENRLKTNEARSEFPVLILWKDHTRVAYLCYYIFDAVKIVYVETHPDFVGRGHASELVDELCRRFHQELDMKAQPTCLEAKRLLKRYGFEQVSEGSLDDWVLRKGK